MSNSYTCNICQRTYSSPQSLCNHRRIKHKVYMSTSKVDRVSTLSTFEVDKKSVLCIKSYTCNFCSKPFNYRQSKSRHEKICKHMDKIGTDKELLNKEVINTINNNINNGNINNTNNTNNINITVNNFSSDNTNYISDKFKNNILKYFENNNKFHIPIPKIVENLKFNPNHKENNNMKITNIKSDVGQKYENNKWTYCKKQDMLDEAHKIAVILVENWIKENNGNISKDTADGFQDYLKINKEYIKKIIFDEINKVGYVYYKNHMEPVLDN